jgi:outer membrane murein-binding lipoprotein Lpp
VHPEIFKGMAGLAGLSGNLKFVADAGGRHSVICGNVDMIENVGRRPGMVDRQYSADRYPQILPGARTVASRRLWWRGNVVPGRRSTMADIDLGQRLCEDLGGLWRQVGTLTRAVTVFDVRFDRIDADIATLKADVAVLKTDVAELKTDVAGLKTDVAGLKTDVAGLKTDAGPRQSP